MISKTSIITRKLLNLYRQHHVIYGGWAAINPILLNESDDSILHELKTLPTGKKLVQHIENLQSGKTPMDSIDKNLVPYGKLMSTDITSVKISNDELNQIKTALSEFTPDENGLNNFTNLPAVKKFGSDWLLGIQSALHNDKSALEKLDVVRKTGRAYHLWKSAHEILSLPITNRTRAMLQVELPEFESYLPMFGDSGTQILEKLRTVIKKS